MVKKERPAGRPTETDRRKAEKILRREATEDGSDWLGGTVTQTSLTPPPLLVEPPPRAAAAAAACVGRRRRLIERGLGQRPSPAPRSVWPGLRPTRPAPVQTPVPLQTLLLPMPTLLLPLPLPMVLPLPLPTQHEVAEAAEARGYCGC